MSGTRLVKDLPPALQSKLPVNHPLQEVDLATCAPYVVSPQAPSFQVELSICTRYDVPLNTLTLETSLNSFSVAQNPKTNSLTFPHMNYLPEGSSSEKGLKLIVDNGSSPNSELGPHTRVSWSVDTTRVASKTAAVAFALSSSDITSLRMLAFKLFRTHVDPRTGHVEREQVMARTAVMDNVINQRCSGHKKGTIVLAVLSRSTAWWHIHMPLAYAQQTTALEFSTVTCRPRTWGQDALITGMLAGIQQRGGFGYPDFHNITITVESARGLPVTPWLEQLTCGQMGTYVRPSVRTIDTLTGWSKSSPHPREYPTRRVERSGGLVWDAVERVPLGLSLYHVNAATANAVRITLYTGGRHECDVSAHADDAAADQQGGTDGTYQWRDVSVAELWQLLPHGEADIECAVELRMNRGPNNKSDQNVATIVARVAVHTDAQN